MLKVYSVSVTETTSVYYTVEAHNKEEAEKIFDSWANDHAEIISNDMMKTGGDWEYSEADEDPYTRYVDIPYEEVC